MTWRKSTATVPSLPEEVRTEDAMPEPQKQPAYDVTHFGQVVVNLPVVRLSPEVQKVVAIAERIVGPQPVVVVTDPRQGYLPLK